MQIEQIQDTSSKNDLIHPGILTGDEISNYHIDLKELKYLKYLKMLLPDHNFEEIDFLRN